MLSLHCCECAFSSCGEWGLCSYGASGVFVVMVHGFSLQWFLLLHSTSSRLMGWVAVTMGLVTLQHVNLPRPGIEPMFPALVGRFLTTGPPGKSQTFGKLVSYHTKCLFMLGFTHGVVHSMGLDKYIIMCIHHYSMIQNTFAALKLFCTQPIHSSFGNHWCLSSLHGLIFFQNVIYLESYSI